MFFKTNKWHKCQKEGHCWISSIKARSHCSDNDAKRMHSIGWMSVCVFCVEQVHQWNAFSLRRYRSRYRCSGTRPLTSPSWSIWLKSNWMSIQEWSVRYPGLISQPVTLEFISEEMRKCLTRLLHRIRLPLSVTSSSRILNTPRVSKIMLALKKKTENSFPSLPWSWLKWRLRILWVAILCWLIWPLGGYIRTKQKWWSDKFSWR